MVLKCGPVDVGYQLEAFLLYADLQTGKKTATDIYNEIIRLIENNNYQYIRSITLRGVYDLYDALEEYFTEEPTANEEELLELLG